MERSFDMELKATLKKTKPVFDIEIDGINFGTFIQVSEWEGFKKLKNDKSEFLIIAESPVSFDNIFGSFFGLDDEKQVPIVQASTSIINTIEKLKKKNRKSQKPTNIHKRIKGYNRPIYNKMPKPPAMPPKK